MLCYVVQINFKTKYRFNCPGISCTKIVLNVATESITGTLLARSFSRVWVFSIHYKKITPKKILKNLYYSTIIEDHSLIDYDGVQLCGIHLINLAKLTTSVEPVISQFLNQPTKSLFHSANPLKASSLVPGTWQHEGTFIVMKIVIYHIFNAP